MAPILEGKLIGLDQKNRLKKKVHDLKNQNLNKARSNSKI